MHVRPATFADAARIAEIYADNVENGTGTFEEAPAPAHAEIATRMAKVLDAGWPWLVAEEDGVILGYAYAAQFRDRSAYRYCAEDSIYIAPEARRRGVGAALLEELLTSSKTAGFRTILAIIGDSANTGSIALHHRFGFVEIGTMKAIGYKFDRWLDVVTMQLTFPD